MVANMLFRLFIFIMYFVYFSFCLQNSSLKARTTISDLINSRIQKDQCNISLNSLAFSACDRPTMNFDAVQSVFFRDEVYLCMGVYDMVLYICSQHKNNQNITSRIQEAVKEFESDTKDKIYGVKSICNGMKTIKFEAANMGKDPWLTKLNSTLQNSCECTCTKGDEVNPLCIFLLWGNTLRTELKVEQENVADMNVNTSKLFKKLDEETLNSQPREKNLREPKIPPSPIVDSTNISLNELDGNHNLEELASKRQDSSPISIDPNYDLSPSEDQDIKLSDETKLSTSAETSTKQPLTTSSIEAVQHSDTDATNFEDHLKGDLSSATLPEALTTAWKFTSFTKDDVELTDSVLPSMYRKHFDNAEDSHFFAYFMAVVAICIIAYLIYHNKHKLLALILEGRRRREMRRTTHGGYRKLDSSLEEAVTSTCSTSVTHVIY